MTREKGTPLQSAHSKPFFIFFDDFSSFLLFAATTPSSPATLTFISTILQTLLSLFLSLLLFLQSQSTCPLPDARQKSHSRSSDTSLDPAVSCTHWSPSDHFPVFTRLSTNTESLFPPTFHSFWQLCFMDVGSFVTDLKCF